jgi:hypothetical protein
MALQVLLARDRPMLKHIQNCPLTQCFIHHE